MLGADCTKKWINIRDTFNKNKGKRLGTGSAAQSKIQRNELMSFLNETVTVNKRFVENTDQFSVLVLYIQFQFFLPERQPTWNLKTM